MENGEKIGVNIDSVPDQLIRDVLEHEQACISKGESRDLCAAKAIVALTQFQLEGVIRVTQTELKSLEEEIGVSVADLIQEPLYCDYSPTDEILGACQTSTEAVTLAGLDVRIAKTRKRRIEAETREAQIDQATVEAETRVAIKRETLATIETERDAERERADANAAVLEALQRVAAENLTN